MNDRDKASQGVPFEEETAGSSGGAPGSKWGRSWEDDAGFSSAAPPESDAPPVGREKSPFLAGIMGILPGAGHLYLGATNRGLFFFGSFLAIIFALNSWALGALHPLLGLLMPFLIIYNIVDAARVARAINRAVALGQPTPRFGVPWISARDGADARISGYVLIGIGVLLLGVTRFDWDLDWLIDWWPVALIVIGARMLSRSREDTGD